MISQISGYGAYKEVSALDKIVYNNTQSDAKPAPLPNSGYIEDKAIISSQAKLLSAQEDYQSGKIDETQLAVKQVESKVESEAAINVFNAKDDMTNKIIRLGEDQGA